MRNPEIQRNLWLEFSWHRLIAMPVVLGLIFLIVGHQADDNAKINLANSFIVASGVLFFLIVKLWGGYQAANSVIEEVNDHTWDLQKLSALSPWSLTIGKLFGSTLYAWYGGIVCFIVFAIAISAAPDKQDAGWDIVLFLTGGITVHAAALLASMVDVQNETRPNKKLRPIFYLMFGLFVGNWFTSMDLWRSMTAGFLPKAVGQRLTQELPPIVWYSTAYNHAAFTTCEALAFLAWLILGIYWLMRAQMKMKTGPWMWAGFLLFWAFVLMGFDAPPEAPPPAFKHPSPMIDIVTYGTAKSFYFLLFGLYFIAFRESWNGVYYRRLVDACKVGNYAKCLQLCPRWFVTFLLCVAFAFGVQSSEISTVPVPFVFLCFAARDMAILHFFKLSPTSRRPMQTTYFYLAMLYILLPFLLGVFHMPTAAFYFVPLVSAAWGMDASGILLSGLMQTLIICVFIALRWRKNWATA